MPGAEREEGGGRRREGWEGEKGTEGGERVAMCRCDESLML